MTTTKTLTVGAEIQVRFPSVNKNDTLLDNDTAIAARSSLSRCRVCRVIELTLKDWADVTQSLLEDRGSLWGQIGGQDLSPLDREAFRVLCLEHGADADSPRTWIGQDRLLNWFRTHSFTEVVAVTCQGMPPFLVNTEGHDYARYVGRLA